MPSTACDHGQLPLQTEVRLHKGARFDRLDLNQQIQVAGGDIKAYLEIDIY